MRFHKSIALMLAALMLAAGAAAAMPGNAPSDAGNATDADDGAADDEAAAADDAEMNETDEDTVDEARADDANDARGPPADMPEQVPDHVSTIHDVVRQFLDDDLDGSLGESVSDVANSSESTDKESVSADA